jgi:Cu/Ag efflux pump CusA
LAEVLKQIKDVDGVKDPGIIKNIGQPEVSVVLDRDKMAAYGVMPMMHRLFWKWLSEEKQLQKCLTEKENSRFVFAIPGIQKRRKRYCSINGSYSGWC